MAAVVSFASRPADLALERPETPPVPIREVAPPPVDPTPGAASGRFARTFDVTKFRRGNVHTHTNRSDGDSDPIDVYTWYRDRGYDFVAITDHNTFINPDDFKSIESADFVILGGEEVTMTGAGRQVHVNALCTDHRLPGGKFASVQGALGYGVDAIRRAGGIALINHPNFNWGIAPADLPAALGAQLLEIESGHPSVATRGNRSHPSHEALWDMALTAGLDFMGVAVDDAHHLRQLGRRSLSHPGRAWVEVFSDSLSKASLCQALSEGMLYASTGPVLARIAVTDDTYAVWPSDLDAEVQFIGIEGQLLDTHKVSTVEPSALYKIRGAERYVRARVVDARGRTAWTPAVRVIGRVPQAAGDRAALGPSPG